MRISILTIFIFLLSCSSDKDTQADFYIIKPIDSTQKVDALTKSDIPPPPPVPTMFYGLHNFILTDDSRVFYHDNHVFHRCGTGIDFSKPPRLFITADSLLEIDIADLKTFLQKLTPDSNYTKKWFSANIASTTDTIRNPALKIITDYFATKQIKYYGIRRLTEEEEYALESKIKKTPYDPTTAEFRVGFDADYSILSDTLRQR